MPVLVTILALMVMGYHEIAAIMIAAFVVYLIAVLVL